MGILCRSRSSGRKLRPEIPEQAQATLERQLTRLGEPCFVCDELEIDLSQMYFFPGFNA